ncbi:MAG: endo-1,4-beta-xylanase [Mucilaginibacter sp.]
MLLVMLLNASCSKNGSSPSNNQSNNIITALTIIPGYTDTTGTLKALTASYFTNMGMAVTYGPMLGNVSYLATVKTNANIVTFGNELKEGSIVKNDGSYDYATADALYNICANNGLQVYGHTLVWHSQQNVTYLKGLITAAGTAQAATVIDAEMKRYITTTINHYANKIRAWDVVNEVISDNNGVMRSDANTTVSAANANSVFLYGQYLGTKYDQNNYVLKAFQYARLADPTVLRFINDYNLDYSRVKTDSLVALVSFINKNGAALVDGIGTQMHISINSNKDNIDYSFQALAATGLKIRISEMDIVTNTTKASGFTPDATALAAQAAMYKYVIQSYLKNVPFAQRYGITVWGVADTDSWLNSTASPDVPLLFDKNYAKKSTFSGFKQGLQ